MPIIKALIQGQISRALPLARTDDDASNARLAKYREIYAISHVRKQHALVDEGSYFLVNNGQTGILKPTLNSNFSHLDGALIVVNSSQPADKNAKRIHLDWLHLVCTDGGNLDTGTTTIDFAWTVDANDRRNTLSATGVDLTSRIINPNFGVATSASVARVSFGNINLRAASGAVRFIVGQRQLRQTTGFSALCVPQDSWLFTFGSVEPNYGPQTDISSGKIEAGCWTITLPGVVIGPGQCAILHLWANQFNTVVNGITFLPELAWWER